ncbi:MAG: hypothetical protein K2Q20_05695 [Phycisphaerales bacterium]|nr:hypothetical protein [Phycisphaerales bacterium]
MNRAAPKIDLLSDDEFARLAETCPDIASKLVAEKMRAEDERAAIDAILADDEAPEIVDGRVCGGIQTESGEARDRDAVFVAGCPACERGAPRAYALHNCGKANPPGMPAQRFFGDPLAQGR